MRGTATAPGTGSFTLAASTGAAQTFGARLASTNRVWYAATDGVSRWEVGYGTFTSPTTLARTTILESSNSDLVVDFSSGVVDIFCDLPASVLDTLNLIEETLASAATTDLGSIQGKCIQLTGTTGPTSFGTSKNKERLVRYTGAGLTITNSATLVCPGAQNLTLVTDDIFYAVSDNTATPIWRILWRQPAAGNTGRLVAVTAFTANGTWTKAANSKSVFVEVKGGGGGGGGVSNAAGYLAAAGGSEGGVARKFISAPGATETVTIGAGGTGGTNTGGTGVVGGTSSFGSWCSATGGLGGNGAAITGGTQGGVGGSGVSGDHNERGAPGHQGVAYTAGALIVAGPGGGRGGGNAVANASFSGIAGLNGGGGSGAGSLNGAAGLAGGAGGNGYVIVWEYA